MAKSTSVKKEVKTPKTVENIEETASYEEQVNKRIDAKAEAETETESAKVESENIATTNKEEVLGVLAVYKSAYPKNKVFHIATDGQVFLEASLSDARNFQKTLTGSMSDLRSVEVY